MSTVYGAEVTLHSLWDGALDFVYQRPADPTGAFPSTNQVVVPNPSTPTPLYAYPITYGLRQTGHPPASPVAATDAEVAAAAGNWDMFIELAEYRMLNSMLGSFTDVDESDFGRSASYNQFRAGIQARLDAIMKVYGSLLSPYRPGASSGVIRHTPATAFAPRWRPGYGGPSGRGFGGYGGYGGYGGGC